MGVQGHIQYKQNNDKTASDEYLSLVCFVSLKLVSDDDSNTLLAFNPKISITHYYRAIKLIVFKRVSNINNVKIHRLKFNLIQSSN